MPLETTVEQKWTEFLAGLSPWDLHTLMRCELEWHDLFRDGLVTKAELRLWILREQGLREPE